jgi:hypothetical protein
MSSSFREYLKSRKQLTSVTDKDLVKILDRYLTDLEIEFLLCGDKIILENIEKCKFLINNL